MPVKVTKLYAFDGLKRVDIQEAAAGDIVCLAGIEDITIQVGKTGTLTPVAHLSPVEIAGTTVTAAVA